MGRKSILILDSGIGGLAVLGKLEKEIKGVDLKYFGDNKNAPYGELDKKKLLCLAIENINGYVDRNTVCIVLACNTLSVNIRKELEKYFNLKVFGVFPPVESATMKYGSTFLLCTNATAKNYVGVKGVTTLGFSELALDIEQKAKNDTIDRVDISYHLDKKCKDFSKVREMNSIGSVILGCTHYSFIKNQISDHLNGKVYLDGIDNSVKMVKKYVNTLKNSPNGQKSRVIFVGENKKLNEKIYKKWINNV